MRCWKDVCTQHIQVRLRGCQVRCQTRGVYSSNQAEFQVAKLGPKLACLLTATAHLKSFCTLGWEHSPEG